MTYLEKLRMENPHMDELDIELHVLIHCPHEEKGEVVRCPKSRIPDISCQDCWDREISDKKGDNRE